MRAVYEGSDVFVWLATYWLWQEPVLPSAPFPHAGTSYKKGLVDSGKSYGVLVVSPLIASCTRTRVCLRKRHRPNPFANVTIKIDVTVYTRLPPNFDPLFSCRIDDFRTVCFTDLCQQELILCNYVGDNLVRALE